MLTRVTRWCILILSSATGPSYEWLRWNTTAWKVLPIQLRPLQKIVSTCMLKLKLDDSTSRLADEESTHTWMTIAGTS